MQIYFPASLELQDELIKAGFKVPKPTQIPIIYSNSGGWIGERKPLNVELIDPEQYDKSPEELGWIRVDKGYLLPKEESYLKITHEDELIRLNIEIKSFHLERASRRGVNMEKWKNWIAIYLDLKDVHEIAEKLTEKIGEIDFFKKFYIKHEVLPGLEDTYFVYKEGRFKEFGLPIVEDFSFCLGCFPNVISYLKYHAEKTKASLDLKLRIERDPKIPSYLKIGIANVKGKHPQLMIKLSSSKLITIKGVLKPTVTGKGRGKLTYCNHKEKTHWISVDAREFARAIRFWSYVLNSQDISVACNKRGFRPDFFKWEEFG